MLVNCNKNYSLQNSFCALSKKQSILDIDKEMISYFADLNILSVYFKAIDDIHDQKSLKGKIIKIFLKGPYNKINTFNREMVLTYQQIMNELFVNEENFNKDYYLYTIEKFAKNIANLATEKINHTDKTILNRIIFYVIYLIYLNDAIEDIEKDIKTNQFNPIVEFGGFKEKNVNKINEIRVALCRIIISQNSKFEILLDSLNYSNNNLMKKLYHSILSKNSIEFIKGEIT